MQKWKYLVLWFTPEDGPGQIENICDTYGGQGYELVSVCWHPKQEQFYAWFKKDISTYSIDMEFKTMKEMSHAQV